MFFFCEDFRPVGHFEQLVLINLGDLTKDPPFRSVIPITSGKFSVLSFVDQIALPDFNAGAMENWGLITYRETALLFDPQTSANGNKQRIAVVVAHELAHMVVLQPSHKDFFLLFVIMLMVCIVASSGLETL